jgi:hypothetical protein
MTNRYTDNLDFFFKEYKELLKPIPPSRPWTKDTADNALDYLQFQFQETAPSVFEDFHQRWLDGQPANQPLRLRNVAYFYDPTLEHHGNAVNFLQSQIAPDTYMRFVDIWYGDKVWNPPIGWTAPAA